MKIATSETPLHLMTRTTPTVLWNDSCSLQELGDSIEHNGTVDATCNPVIALSVLKKEWALLGSNLQAAVVSGIKTNRSIIPVYTFAGFLAAVAAIVLTARIGSGQPGLGLGYELDGIAASVIGGTSLAGGLGSAGGTLIGALIIAVMKNGLNILNVSADFQQISRALIIVVAVTIDVRKNVRRS